MRGENFLERKLFSPRPFFKELSIKIFFAFYGGRKLFEKSFSSPKPQTFKNFETGVYFFVIIYALND